MIQLLRLHSRPIVLILGCLPLLCALAAQVWRKHSPITPMQRKVAAFTFLSQYVPAFVFFSYLLAEFKAGHPPPAPYSIWSRLAILVPILACSLVVFTGIRRDPKRESNREIWVRSHTEIAYVESRAYLYVIHTELRKGTPLKPELYLSLSLAVTAANALGSTGRVLIDKVSVEKTLLSKVAGYEE